MVVTMIEMKPPDPATEQLIPLYDPEGDDALLVLEQAGVKISRASLFRALTEGLRTRAKGIRVKVPAFKQGRRFMTSREALARMLAGLELAR